MIRAIEGNALPTAKVSKKIYPNTDYKTYGWSDATALKTYSDALGVGLEADFAKGYAGFHFDFNGMKSMDGYSGLKVTYWPGTCMKTGVYFDSFQEYRYPLKNGTKSGDFMVAEIPLSRIVDVSLTPQNKYAAFRLNLQSRSAGETCIVKSISLY